MEATFVGENVTETGNITFGETSENIIFINLLSSDWFDDNGKVYRSSVRVYRVSVRNARKGCGIGVLTQPFSGVTHAHALEHKC